VGRMRVEEGGKSVGRQTRVTNDEELEVAQLEVLSFHVALVLVQAPCRLLPLSAIPEVALEGLLGSQEVTVQIKLSVIEQHSVSRFGWRGKVE
jgi:hypothetical protein